MQLCIERDSLLYILPNLSEKGVIEKADGLYIRGRPVIKFRTRRQGEPSFPMSGIEHRNLAVLDWFCNPNKKIRMATEKEEHVKMFGLAIDT